MNGSGHYNALPAVSDSLRALVSRLLVHLMPALWRRVRQEIAARVQGGDVRHQRSGHHAYQLSLTLSCQVADAFTSLLTTIY